MTARCARFASWFAGVLAVVVLGGCSSFGEAPAGSDEAGAGSEAGGADASAPEGAALPGPVTGCLAPVCQDFETDAWGAAWTTVGASQIGVTAGPSTSGSRSLELTLDADAPSYILRTLGPSPVSRVVASMNMLVVERGGGEVDFLQIIDGLSGDARGVFFVHAQATGKLTAEVLASSPVQYTPTEEQSLTTYTRVVIAVDLVRGTYSVTVGASGTAGSLDPAWKPTQLYVAVGAPFAKGVAATKPWRVRFDDVSVVTEP